jgi:hypothetical protein
MLRTVPKETLFDKKIFPLISPTYDWVAIRESTDQILSSCDVILPYTLSDALTQTWSVLPGYLKRYRKFYADIHETDNPQLTFMHNLLIEPFFSATADQIQRALKLPADMFLVLETGIITKAQPNCPYMFNHLISKSQTQIRAAVNLLNRSMWDGIDIDGILKEIRNKTGARYYNISSDSKMNSRTVSRMTYVNDEYQIVADAGDEYFFDHIIGMLTHAKMLTPPDDISSELAASSVPPKKAPRSRRREQTIEIGDTEYTLELSDSDIEIVVHTSDDDLEKQSPPQRQTKQTNQKRKKIPAKVRQLTWRQYIGRSMDGNCWCCDEEISFENWHAGHVLAHVHGGKDTVKNLRPLCVACNLSMHDTHMADFIRDHDMKGKGAKEFKHTFPAQSKQNGDEDVDDLAQTLSSLAV